MSTFRFISPTVIDKVNDCRLMVDDCSVSVSMAHGSIPILGGGFGTIVEDIDDFSKTISLKGPVLLKSVYEKGSIKIGYTDNISNQKYFDLYRWIVEDGNNIGYQFLKSISLNISKTAEINIEMQTNSPFLQTKDGGSFLQPEIQIFNSGILSSNTEMDTGRVLKNYDIYMSDGSSNSMVNNSYVSNVKYNIDFSWNRIKSIPTISFTGTTPPDVQYPSAMPTNANGVQSPPPNLFVLNEIKISSDFDVYIQDYSDGKYEEDFLGKYFGPELFLKARLKDIDTSNNSILTSLMRKWIDINLCQWRLISSSSNSVSEDICKISRKYESITYINPINAKINPLQ